MKVSIATIVSNSQITDEQIIDRVRGGEKDAYEVIIRRHNTTLYRVARGILSKEEEIQDVMQEAYLKAFEKLYQFKGDSRFSTWLTRILINAAFAKFNESKKMQLLDIDDLREEENPADEETVPERSDEMTAHLRKALEEAIDSLPSMYRTIFMLRELENMSVSEAAYCLDISEDNVKVRLHRAKEMLRSVLRKNFAGADLFGFGGERCDLMAQKVMRRIIGLSQ